MTASFLNVPFLKINCSVENVMCENEDFGNNSKFLIIFYFILNSILNR